MNTTPLNLPLASLLIVGAVALFCLATAAGVFAGRFYDRRIARSYASILLLTGALALLFLSGPAGCRFAGSRELMLVAFLLSGPALYIYSGYVSGFIYGEGAAVVRHFIQHVFAVFILAAAMSSGYETPLFSETGLSRYSMVIIYLHISLYTAAAVRKILNELSVPVRFNRGLHQLIFVLSIHLLGVNFFFISGIISGDLPPVLFIAWSLPVYIHYLTALRYPILSGMIGPKKKEAPGKTTGADEAGELGLRIQSLLENEKIYLYEDLTVSMLANELDIPAHQASLYINTVMKKNFSSMINEYRINDARHRLIHEPDKSIITIAFEVGFNSKASFNRVFKHATDMSPTEYRKFFIRMSKEQLY